MSPFILFLCLFHTSGPVPMRLPRRASNSEEVMPYGPYGYLNLQVPHVGSMYGFGFPHYSPMTQLQQAFPQQPFSWQPQSAVNTQQNHKETVASQVLRSHLKPPQSHQQQPAKPVQLPQPNRPQTKPTFQHVTKQPQQSLQLPPAPDPQPPKMFPPFANPMNPYQQYWQAQQPFPQGFGRPPSSNEEGGNYFGYFGFGGRPPYNSEEMNENEEAANPEKESPKAESPVTESASNATMANTNSTTVDQNHGNNTAHNENLAGENSQSPSVKVDGQNVTGAAVVIMTPSIQTRDINMIHGASNPSHHHVKSGDQETIPSDSQHNPQQKYYTVDKIILGRGDHSFPYNTHPHEHVRGQAQFVNSHFSENNGYFRETPSTYGDNFPGRTIVPRGNIMNSHLSEARGMSQDTRFSKTRNEGLQQYSAKNVLKNGDFSKQQENDQGRGHSSLLNNRNNLPNHRLIIVRPQRNHLTHRSSVQRVNTNEYFPVYNRHRVIENPGQNIPSGIFSSRQKIPFDPQNNGADQKSNIHNTVVTPISHNDNVLLRSEDPLTQREILQHPEDATFSQGEVRPFDRSSTWNNRRSNSDMGTVNSGQQQETIYVVSPIPSGNIPIYTDNNPKQSPGHSLNSATEQQGSPQYNSLSPREMSNYPESELYGQTRSMPHSLNNRIDFATTHYENPHSQSYDLLGPPRDTHITSAGQNRRELYITNDSAPLGQKIYLSFSNPDQSKHAQRSQFPANGPLHEMKHTPMSSHKVVNSWDQNGYLTGYEADSQILNKNTPYSTNRPFDPIESTGQYLPGDELHLVHNTPAHLQLSPYSEIHSWGYNPDELPSTQNENSNYDSYPSGMRIYSPHQRETGTDYGDVLNTLRHYVSNVPVSEADPMTMRGMTYPFVHNVHCSHGEQGYPSGHLDSAHDFRVTLKKYNEGVPYLDRTHRQHTRNVMDGPKISCDQNNNAIKPSCNISNNTEHVPGPCATQICDEPNSGFPCSGFNVLATKPCSTRGDADNYLAPDQEESRFQRKTFITSEKPGMPSIHVQERGSHHAGMENGGRLKESTGKMLRILTCFPNRQKYISDIATNADKSKPDAFPLKHDIPTGKLAPEARVDTLHESSMSHQPSENKQDPVSDIPDCLLLNN
ncbi:hypothetical protein FKM82_001423 [Ascaphus truei]